MKDEMAFTINCIISLAICLIFSTGIGSGLRVVTHPQPFTCSTKELNISCVADEPAYMTKSIISLQISRHIEDKPIAIINVPQVLKMADGIKDNLKAEGHIDSKSNKSYLTLTIDKPNRQDAGTYRCQMFFIKENSQIVEKNVIGNVTYQDPDITGVETNLDRQVSSLLTKLIKQNNTLQTLQKQDITLKELHSQQKLDIDTLKNKIDRQNNITMKLTEQNEKQAKQIEEQAKQIDIFHKDNIHKQQQLDTLMDYIKQRNETIQSQDEIRNKIALLHPGWEYYKGDMTLIKAFGKGSDRSKWLSWPEARKVCQTFDGDLVQIHDEAKNKFVWDLFEGERDQNAWIGVKNQARRGFDFKFVDGSDLGDYHPWQVYDPSGDGDDDHKCVGMWTSLSDPGIWFDNHCRYTRAYVCSISSINVV